MTASLQAFVLLLCLTLSGFLAPAAITGRAEGDVDGDGVMETLYLSAAGHVAVVRGDGMLSEPPHIFDMSRLRPCKLVVGDINGDGMADIGLCVIKKTAYHPVDAKRPFFFTLRGGNLEPLWLGSRLSRPFDDYVLVELTGDGLSYVAAIEETASGGRAVRAYVWAGFGLEVFADSAEYDFVSDIFAADGKLCVRVKIDGQERDVVLTYTGNGILSEEE